LSSLPSNQITTVLFDLDGTLRFSRPLGNELFRDIAAELGVETTPEGERRARRWIQEYWANSATLISDQETFEHNSEAFWQNYGVRHLTVLGCPLEQAEALSGEINQRMLAEYQPEDVIPDETPETLDALKSAGYTLGLVTNRHDPVHDYLQEKGLWDYFELVLAAGEVGVWKPHAAIFQHALERIDAQPGQAVYIGDNYYADVIGAQNAGIAAVLLDPDGIFPDLDCPTVAKLNDLVSLLAAKAPA
jgi:HAD superfamily hydrolase (TIGR01549 family)